MFRVNTMMKQIAIVTITLISMTCSSCTITVKNADGDKTPRSEEHTSELQSHSDLV